MWAVHRGVKAARATLGAMPRPPDELGAHMSIAGGLHRALERAGRLGLSGVGVHPGSHLGAGVVSGLARVVAALDEVTRRTPGYKVSVALENTAGAGQVIGRTFEELGTLLARAARSERIG